MAVKVVVQFEARSDRAQAFERVMHTVARDLPNVAGCVGVEVLQNQEDACRFTLVETWDSRERHQAHIEGLIADGTWTAIADHLCEDPVSGYFQHLCTDKSR